MQVENNITVSFNDEIAYTDMIAYRGKIYWNYELSNMSIRDTGKIPSIKNVSKITWLKLPDDGIYSMHMSKYESISDLTGIINDRAEYGKNKIDINKAQLTEYVLMSSASSIQKIKIGRKYYNINFIEDNKSNLILHKTSEDTCVIVSIKNIDTPVKLLWTINNTGKSNLDAFMKIVFALIDFIMGGSKKYNIELLDCATIDDEFISLPYFFKYGSFFYEKYGFKFTDIKDPSYTKMALGLLGNLEVEFDGKKKKMSEHLIFYFFDDSFRNDKSKYKDFIEEMNDIYKPMNSLLEPLTSMIMEKT